MRIAHRAGLRAERGGGSYGRPGARRAVAAAKGASMQISVDRKGLSKNRRQFHHLRAATARMGRVHG